MGGSLAIPAGELIYGVGEFIRLYWSGDDRISNVQLDGTVWAASTTGVSSVLAGFNMDDVRISGTIGAEAARAFSDTGQANAYAVTVAGSGRFFTNTGTIYAVTDGGLAHALSHWGTPRIDNSGLIAARSPNPFPEANATQALAISATNGATLHNRAGGRILAEGLNATAIILGRGTVFRDEPEVLNEGIIHAVSLDPQRPSVGILAAHLDSERMAIVNKGVIEADIAIQGDSSNFPRSAADEQITNLGPGIIRGIIDTSLGDDTIINRGSLVGDVRAGQGNDLFDTAGGQWIGNAFLDWGNDQFIGSDGADRVDGGRMNDRLSGNGGDDLLLGGLGDDVLAGDAGNDGLYGDWGDDLLILAGADRALGGPGDDRFEPGDLAFALIDGGAGHDRLLLPVLAAVIDIGAIVASDRVTGIEEIVVPAGGRVALLSSAVTAEMNGLRVSGAASAELVLAGDWVTGAVISHGGASFQQYQAGAVTISVALALPTSRQLQPPIDLKGLDPVAGGAAAPRLDDVPALVPGAITLNDHAHVVEDDVVIESYETWRGGSERAALITAFNLNATLINKGVLISDYGRALNISQLASFNNSGSIIAGTTSGDGGATAVANDLLQTFLNSGSISAIARSGQVVGVQASIGGGTVNGFDNQGLIRAESANGTAFAVILRGSSLNNGRIEASGASHATGIYLNFGAVQNSGSIVATASAALARLDVVAINLPFGGQVRNSGTIEAPTAILTGPNSFSGSVIRNDPGGQIKGDIQTGTNNDSVINQGLIAGEIRLGDGNDLYDGAAGQLQGRVAGGGGNDRLTGGSGTDTAVFSGGRRDYEVTRSGDTVTVRDLRANADGTDTLTGIEQVQFADGLMDLIAEELVLFLPGGRDLIAWDPAQGSNGFSYFLRVGGNSQVIASADFTGDGRTDMLFRQPDGGLIRWDVAQGGNGFAVLPGTSGFTVVGLGDLRGNGATDILLQGADRTLRVLDAAAGSADHLFTLTPGWTVKGVANINGTGKDDIIIQNDSSGQVIAFTEGGWQHLLTLSPGWQIAGFGDVLGGLADDLVLMNSNRDTVFWDVGRGGEGFQTFATITAGWSIAGLHDLSGDGRDDVLLRNENGAAIYWTGTEWGSLGNVLAGTELVGTGVFP